MKKIFQTHSAKETEALAGRLLPQLLKSRLMLLSGHLGSGKTTFVKGLAKALGIKERIKSPTYVYVNRYSLINLPSTNYQLQTFLHVDLYRLPKNSNPTVLAELGLEDLLGAPNTLTCIEWPDRLHPMLLKGTKIKFTKRKKFHEITVEVENL